jgi:hypothetical protein
VAGLAGVATVPAGAPPFWLMSTRTASFFSAVGGRFFLTVTISLCARVAWSVRAGAGTAAAQKTNPRATAAAAWWRSFRTCET